MSVISNGTTTGIGSGAVATANTSIAIVGGEIEVLSDTLIAYQWRLGNGNWLSGVATVSSLVANPLTVNLEYWVATASDPITVRGARITARRPGMKSLPAL